jgi:hypothetical protein
MLNIREIIMLKKTIVLLAMVCAQPASAFNLDDLKGELDKTMPQQTADAPAAPRAAPTAVAQPSGNPLANISNKDQVGSLKQALGQGIETAVASLSKTDGYLGNPKVRIPMPENLQKLDNGLRRLGMGKYADELNVSMNRAAEAAVPEAKALLVSAVKNMSVTDAKNILMGGDNAATQYFRANTETALSGKFQPIVTNAMQKVQLAQKYDQFAGKGECQSGKLRHAKGPGWSIRDDGRTRKGDTCESSGSHQQFGEEGVLRHQVLIRTPYGITALLHDRIRQPSLPVLQQLARRNAIARRLGSRAVRRAQSLSRDTLVGTARRHVRQHPRRHDFFRHGLVAAAAKGWQQSCRVHTGVLLAGADSTAQTRGKSAPLWHTRFVVSLDSAAG